jgi:opacity protein-like surface antigen
MNTSATGFGFDAGVQYRFREGISIGASIKNIGANMKYSGEDLQGRTAIPGTDPGTVGGTYQIVAEEFQIPSYFELSAAYKYNFNEQNDLIFASTFVANNALEDLMNFGLQYGYMDVFFLRGGYNMLLSETSSESIFGFTMGAGVDYNISEEISAVFDYAFRDVKEFPTSNHIFTVKLAFQ